MPMDAAGERASWLSGIDVLADYGAGRIDVARNAVTVGVVYAVGRLPEDLNVGGGAERVRVRVALRRGYGGEIDDRILKPGPALRRLELGCPGDIRRTEGRTGVLRCAGWGTTANDANVLVRPHLAHQLRCGEYGLGAQTGIGRRAQRGGLQADDPEYAQGENENPDKGLEQISARLAGWRFELRCHGFINIDLPGTPAAR